MTTEHIKMKSKCFCFWEAPCRVMKMNILSQEEKRMELYGNPPLEIPRDEIFVFEEEQKKINLKMHRISQVTIF